MIDRYMHDLSQPIIYSCDNFPLEMMNNTDGDEVQTNDTTNLDCPIYTDTSDEWIDFFNFWVGGVFQSFVAIPGFIGKIFNTMEQ